MIKKCKLKYKDIEYDILPGTLLSEFMIKEGFSVSMPCGGMGTCGKCRVRFKSGTPGISAADRRFFTEKELKEGYRLACRAVISNDCELSYAVETLIHHEENTKGKAEALSDRLSDDKAGILEEQGKEYSLVIDIGTTTIAAALLCGEIVINEVTVMNSQAVFGADVISRIKAACDGKAEPLKGCVINDIKRAAEQVISGHLLSKGQSADDGKEKFISVKRTIIAGNTTMLHLLTGDSCEGLGNAPYKPVRLEYTEERISSIPEEFGKVIIFPGISAFVGADIVSGMYALSFDNIPEGKKYMLIDLGTNGEMAVADSEKISVCSTAAGPVFEGGGITCGMAGITGAIEHVSITNAAEFFSKEDNKDSIKVETIGKREPLGICGSGVLEITSELVRTKLVDETGLLRDELFESGITLFRGDDREIFFSQNDIRKVQLAKAAIRSGIDTLLKAHGLRAEDIDTVFLAGGFSEHLNAHKIKYLNMLPEEFLKEGVTLCKGNTSLKGGIRLAGEYEKNEETRKADDPVKRLKVITDKAEYIPLAETDTFSEAFIEAMNF
ncbi:ASKHA domain-containing protein [Butyrivibrio sp. AE3004]|uniref:ASKHA domain-containing protein n=1 Tax=Butyrivibrio sp. AE3004 TaxID=1506994 RepID=UPI000493B777|nr:ASKHA domain-containing protein [Butyrivibrio sp. AE3004]